MNNNLKKLMGAGFLFALTLSAQAGKYTFKVTNPREGAQLTLTFNTDGVVKTVELKNGEGTIELNDFKSQYVTMKYGRSKRTLYLDPAKDLNVTFDATKFYQQIDISGSGAAENKFLNDTKFAKLVVNDGRRAEADFIHRLDSVYNVNMSFLEKAGLPSDFTNIERERLKYLSYAMLPMYQSYYRYLKNKPTFVPTDAYFKKLVDMSPIDSKLMMYPEYRDFINNSIVAQAFRTDGNRYQQFIDFVGSNVNDEKIREYVTNDYAYGQIYNSGVDGADALIDFYHKNVKDTKLTERFDKLCSQWALIKTGNPSPSFSCPDINGKMVSLADLKGKYVYIDVWATWCGPCRGELPSLKKLEEDYAGKGIAFVSLSCDKDKAAWEKMVKSGDMKGIQLHMGPQDEFMNQYMINGIPRFILLDKEGKIIKADAPRPSDPEIRVLFDELLSK